MKCALECINTSLTLGINVYYNFISVDYHPFLSMTPMLKIFLKGNGNTAHLRRIWVGLNVAVSVSTQCDLRLHSLSDLVLLFISELLVKPSSPEEKCGIKSIGDFFWGGGGGSEEKNVDHEGLKCKT